MIRRSSLGASAALASAGLAGVLALTAAPAHADPIGDFRYVSPFSNLDVGDVDGSADCAPIPELASHVYLHHRATIRFYAADTADQCNSTTIRDIVTMAGTYAIPWRSLRYSVDPPK